MEKILVKINPVINPNNQASLIEFEQNIDLNQNHPIKFVDHIKDNYNEVIKSADYSKIPAMACRSKLNNPNYLSIIHTNKSFQELFKIEQSDLINKSYDFLFEDIDLNYNTSDQLEFTNLIQAIKNFKNHHSIISLFDFDKPKQKHLFKINFIIFDQFSSDEKYAIFTFEKIEFNDQYPAENIITNNQSQTILNTLERSLRNERLIREISSLIISDLPINKIASDTAKILCNYLKVDRCIIHDFNDHKINFLEEYFWNYSNSAIDFNNKNDILEYIKFNNNFYDKYCSNNNSIINIIEDLQGDDNCKIIHNFAHNYSIVNHIMVSIIFNKKKIGNIFIHQSEKRTWLEDELQILEIIANQLGVAIAKYYSYQKNLIANQELLEKSQQLQKSLEHEQEIRKMQNEFIALVSHEFKTPLQIIDSTRENILRKIKNIQLIDESVLKSLEKIKNAVQRMNGLINSTLNLAKMESSSEAIKVNLQLINIKKIIEDIIEKNKNIASIREIKISLLMDNNITEIISDSMLIEHILNNIISNAVKYSKENSEVKINIFNQNNLLVFLVKDSGIGIASEELKNIGQKFFRAKNTTAVSGTGIGLYLTKNFIELLKGEFNITSQENFGTEVTIKIPKNI